MTTSNRQSYVLAGLVAAALAVWAGLPLIVLPFAAGFLVFAVGIARIMHKDSLTPADAGRIRYLDGSHERIDDPER